jgi:hypothetical protein
MQIDGIENEQHRDDLRDTARNLMERANDLAGDLYTLYTELPGDLDNYAYDAKDQAEQAANEMEGLISDLDEAEFGPTEVVAVVEGLTLAVRWDREAHQPTGLVIRLPHGSPDKILDAEDEDQEVEMDDSQCESWHQFLDRLVGQDFTGSSVTITLE